MVSLFIYNEGITEAFEQQLQHLLSLRNYVNWGFELKMDHMILLWASIFKTNIQLCFFCKKKVGFKKITIDFAFPTTISCDPLKPALGKYSFLCLKG